MAKILIAAFYSCPQCFPLVFGNPSLQSKLLLTLFLTKKAYFVKKTLHIKRGSPLIKRIARKGIGLFRRIKVTALAIIGKCQYPEPSLIVHQESFPIFFGGKMKKMKVVFICIFIFLLNAELYSIIYCRVEGVIKDNNGLPIENVKISLYKINFLFEKYPFYQTITDKNGFFKIDKIEAEHYYIQCTKKGYISNLPNYILAHYSVKCITSNPNVFILKEGEIKKFTIILGKGGAISGMVNEIDSSGSRLINQVTLILKKLIRPEELSCLSIKSDKDGFIDISTDTILNTANNKFLTNGHYLFDGLEIGSYRLVLRRFRYCDIQLNFEINNEQTIIKDYSYDLTNTTGVKGNITLNNEQPRFAFVQIIDSNGNNIASFQCDKDSGNYAISLINEGNYLIQVYAKNDEGREFIAKKNIVVDKNQIAIVNLNL